MEFQKNGYTRFKVNPDLSAKSAFRDRFVTILQATTEAAVNLSAHGVQHARLDAEILLCQVLTRDRAWLLAHIHDVLDETSLRVYRETIDRRAVREPLQYITGVQEFWGLPFKVTRAVLIPRPETEFAVEAALKSVRDIIRPVIIDLCTGSGCIAVSLARELPGARIFATDRSEAALEIARQNAQAHLVADRVTFLAGDLFQPALELGLQNQADVIVSNPPYVPSGELAALQPEVKDFEPQEALIPGPEGTELHLEIIAQAPYFLTKHGTLIMEMGIGQAEKLSAMTEAAGAYARPEILKDLAGIDRVIKVNKKKQP